MHRLCNDSSRLPYFLIKIGFPKLFDIDSIDRTSDSQRLGVHFSLDTHHKPGAGEWVPKQQLFRDAKPSPDGAASIFDLIVERRELRHRKIERGIMVEFDTRPSRTGFMAVSALDEGRIKRTLRDKIY